MENLDLLRTLIKKHGGMATKPNKDELYETVMNAYSQQEPMTNSEMMDLRRIALQMIANFYGIETEIEWE